MFEVSFFFFSENEGSFRVLFEDSKIFRRFWLEDYFCQPFIKLVHFFGEIDIFHLFMFLLLYCYVQSLNFDIPLIEIVRHRQTVTFSLSELTLYDGQFL